MMEARPGRAERRPDGLVLVDQVGHRDQREVLLLRIVADLTLEQTAEVLGKPAGAVKSLQHRGLAALRKIVEPEGVSP